MKTQSLFKFASVLATGFLLLTSNPAEARDPQGALESYGTLPNKLRVVGWAYDADDFNSKTRVHMYIGGEAGNSQVPSYEIRADKGHNRYNGHGFDAVVDVPAQWCGRQTVRLYALNDVGSGSFQQIGIMTIDIPSSQTSTQNNSAFRQYQKRATQTVPAYTNASLTNRNGSERVDAGDMITVLQESGNSLYVRYPVSNGHKERWVSKEVFERPSGNSVTERMRQLSQNTSGYKVNTRYTGSGECRGFANKVYTTLFNASAITGYAYNNYAASSYSGSSVVGYRHGDFASNDTMAMKNLFQNAKPGSFVQMGRRYRLNSTKTAPGPHTAILFSVSNNGVEFYEANADGKNTIWIKFYSWADLADRNKGFTIYQPNNYALK